MTKSLCVGLIAGLFLSVITGMAHATLHDRGGGLLYDDVLNVTWLQDANYSSTSFYDADGKMSLPDAQNWADQLVFHDCVRNVDYDDWRLPQNLNDDLLPLHYTWWFGGDENDLFSPDSHSELSYMFYANLGLNGYYPNGSWQDDFGIFGDGTFSGQNDVGLVVNLQAGEYWLDYEYWKVPWTDWIFNTNSGEHKTRYQYDSTYVWAVRDGDVAPVPEPSTVFLLGSGLAGLAWFRWKR